MSNKNSTKTPGVNSGAHEEQAVPASNKNNQVQ
jgi:hypothetical protein